jgi:hypothetical protein
MNSTHLTAGTQRIDLVMLLAAVLLLNSSIAESYAQNRPAFRAIHEPVRLSVDPTYQYYQTEDDRAVTQFGARVSAVVPLSRQVHIRAQGGFAQMGGDDLTSVQGVTDLRGSVVYASSLQEGTLVFGIDVNAPIGKQELTDAELETTRLASQNFYDFRVSSFSRGFSVAPRVTWARSMTDELAVGIGTSYQYQRGYRPAATMETNYVPGSAFSLNTGFDYELTSQSALGIDLLFRHHATDQIDGADRFNAGNQLVGTVRYLYRDGFTTIRIIARYANWEDSEFGFQAAAQPERGQVIPSHGMAMAQYQTRFAAGYRLMVRASAHQYSETVQSDTQTIGRLRVAPSFQISDALTLAPHSTLTLGSFSGMTFGMRVESRF